jgi:DNA-binding NarL/FixJ family response regulator
MASAASGPNRARPMRIAVASDQRLVGDSVVEALRNRAFVPLLVQWPPRPTRPPTRSRRRRPFRRSAGPPPDVGLMLSDLARMERVLAARTVLAGLPLPWLVMAGIPRSPIWGALYEGGASLVVPMDTGLVEVADLLQELSAGGRPAALRRESQELISSWRSHAARRSDVAARLQTLTEREGAILDQLHQGLPVRNIAERSEVTESTVRSQVKAILRKLDVNSQMAAVAVYEDVLSDTIYADFG